MGPGNWMSAKNAFQRYMQRRQQPDSEMDMSGMQTLPANMAGGQTNLPRSQMMSDIQQNFGGQAPMQHKPMQKPMGMMPTSSGDPGASAVPNIGNQIDLVRWLLANKNNSPTEVGNVIPSMQSGTNTLFPNPVKNTRGGLNNAVISMIAKNLVGS